jgi:hypothetical protein
MFDCDSSSMVGSLTSCNQNTAVEACLKKVLDHQLHFFVMRSTATTVDLDQSKCSQVAGQVAVDSTQLSNTTWDSNLFDPLGI